MSIQHSSQSIKKVVVSRQLNTTITRINRFRLNGTGKYTVHPKGHISVWTDNSTSQHSRVRRGRERGHHKEWKQSNNTHQHRVSTVTDALIQIEICRIQALYTGPCTLCIPCTELLCRPCTQILYTPYTNFVYPLYTKTVYEIVYTLYTNFVGLFQLRTWSTVCTIHV